MDPFHGPIRGLRASGWDLRQEQQTEYERGLASLDEAGGLRRAMAG